jgi:hypothetical protein
MEEKKTLFGNIGDVNIKIDPVSLMEAGAAIAIAGVIIVLSVVIAKKLMQ